MDRYFQRIIDLADSEVRQRDPKMKWMWGEALLGFALTELDDFLGEERYNQFTRDFCDYWVAHPPRVDQADTSAPALITYAVQKKTGNPGCKVLTDRVIDYIRNEPRLMDDAVNHLGNSPEGRFYPKSIWVDSLMMFSVFPALYGAEQGDGGLLDFAARQPRLYAGYMQDPEKKLWYHSYWVKRRKPYPGKGLFWARGNGWVIAALPMILDQLPHDHPERKQIITILSETSEALLPWQRKDGYWNTILGDRHKSYRESSATALIACGWMHGVRKGFLDIRFKDPAIRAFRQMVENLREEGRIWKMPEISGPTIPLPLFPRLGYRMIPRKDNWSYGVAAALLGGIQYAKLREETHG
jgi:unsaturated rhamnogalacturonyl hydrolase